MNYELEFKESALKEWHKLDNSIWFIVIQKSVFDATLRLFKRCIVINQVVMPCFGRPEFRVMA